MDAGDSTFLKEKSRSVEKLRRQGISPRACKYLDPRLRGLWMISRKSGEMILGLVLHLETSIKVQVRR